MVNRLFFFVTALLLLGNSACVTTGAPQIIIPEHRGQLDASASLGITGANINLLCATGKRHFIAGTYHRSIYHANDHGTSYQELGAGYITADHKKSLMISYGRGKFSYSPFIFVGGLQEQYNSLFGNYSRTSLSFNFKFDPNMGLTSRIDIYEGTDNGSRSSANSSFYHRSIFKVVFEPAFYYKTRKKSGWFFLAGVDLALVNANKGTSQAAFRPNNGVFMSLGANINVLKGRQEPATEGDTR